jgi:hypothetical protein
MSEKVPFKIKILAKLIGVNMQALSNLWKFMDGKKMYFSFFLALVSAIAAFWPTVALTFPNAHWVLVGAAAIQFINAWAHRAYKTLYNEEHQ